MSFIKEVVPACCTIRISWELQNTSVFRLSPQKFWFHRSTVEIWQAPQVINMHPGFRAIVLKQEPLRWGRVVRKVEIGGAFAISVSSMFTVKQSRRRGKWKVTENPEFKKWTRFFFCHCRHSRTLMKLKWFNKRCSNGWQRNSCI